MRSQLAAFLVALACAAPAAAQQRMPWQDLDRNHDGVISRDEWQAAFDRMDTNHDGRISRDEFDAAASTEASQHSPAWRAGYERGRQEGVQAGREDKARSQWDLEGQRELETADSGYQDSMGPRQEYQAGYRAGFRLGYREGFGPR